MGVKPVTKLIAETIAFGGLYFALTIAFAPISFLPLQVRVSDILIPVSIVVGTGVIYGVAVGCFIANMFPVGYTANPLDIFFGSVANLLASYAAYRAAYHSKSKKRIVGACLASTAIVTLIVGTYLPYLILPSVNPADIFWIGYLGVLPGELIAQVVLGVPLVAALRKMMVRRSKD